MADIVLGPGELFIQSQPRCPDHGQMHYDFPMYRWVCHGRDGEGCPRVVTDEEYHRGWEKLGDTEGTPWSWERPARNAFHGRLGNWRRNRSPSNWSPAAGGG